MRIEHLLSKVVLSSEYEHAVANKFYNSTENPVLRRVMSIAGHGYAFVRAVCVAAIGYSALVIGSLWIAGLVETGEVSFRRQFEVRQELSRQHNIRQAYLWEELEELVDTGTPEFGIEEWLEFDKLVNKRYEENRGFYSIENLERVIKDYNSN